MKEHRFFPKIVAGILAAGGIVSHAEQEPAQSVSMKSSAENGVKASAASEKKEMRPEQDPVFCAEHPIEAELRAHDVSVDAMHTALHDASEIVRAHRYQDAKNEEKYFAACRDTERWAQIQKSIHYASEKTGVPERVLIAMGFIESQFDENAERADTNVYGPYQMTLDTAKEAAKDAVACFGHPIEISSEKDLKETKTAARLAALRLRALQQHYGQLGLAVIDYASGHTRLEQKIKEAFPHVDLGEKDWADMGRHHAAELQAQKKRDAILKQMKQGRVTDRDREALRQTIRVFEAAGLAYTKAKNAWKSKRDNLPKTLADAGVTALSLYEYEKKKGGSVPHSIVYSLALDDLAQRANQHARDALSVSKKQSTANEAR